MDPKNKILFVMHSMFYGGAEYQVRNIARRCSENGFQVFYALEDRGDFSSNKKSDDGYFHMNLGKRPLVLAMFIFYIKMFFFLLKKNVNIVFLYEKYGLLSIPIFKLFGIKVVYSERNSGEWVVKRFIYRILLKLCNATTCNSSIAKQVMDAKLNRNTLKINNFVEIPSLKFWGRKNENRLIILLPARISPEKNQLFVINALLSQNFPFAMELILAGKVDDERYEEKIKSCIKEKKGKCTVSFVGFNPNKDEMYENCDMVILPSLSEGTPNVVLECFARRKVILASDIPQNKELFSDDAFLFNPTDDQMFCEKIINCRYLDKDVLNDKIQKNFEFVQRNFGVEMSVNRYVDLFEKLL